MVAPGGHACSAQSGSTSPDDLSAETTCGGHGRLPRRRREAGHRRQEGRAARQPGRGRRPCPQLRPRSGRVPRVKASAKPSRAAAPKAALRRGEPGRTVRGPTPGRAPHGPSCRPRLVDTPRTTAASSRRRRSRHVVRPRCPSPAPLRHRLQPPPPLYSSPALLITRHRTTCLRCAPAVLPSLSDHDEGVGPGRGRAFCPRPGPTTDPTTVSAGRRGRSGGPKIDKGPPWGPPTGRDPTGAPAPDVRELTRDVAAGRGEVAVRLAAEPAAERAARQVPTRPVQRGQGRPGVPT